MAAMTPPTHSIINCNQVVARVPGPKDTLTLIQDGPDRLETGFANN